MSETFNYFVNVTDEENNIPFLLTLNFTSCSVAQWSTRNCSNSSGRELFNSSYYSFNLTSGVLNISFTPQKNDVGSYIINFSVMDNSSLGNKTTSQIVNFTVLNTNSAPYFRYVCDNERNTIENNVFTCWINVSDIDETNNITLKTNYTWFIFNNTGINNITLSVNISTSYNASAMINFTPTDINVGNWSINVTLTDTGGGYTSKSNSTVFWFFINNTEDNVSLDVINDTTLAGDSVFYVNASDNDLLVPDKSVKNETLTYASNTSWVSISTYSALSGVNYTTARININFSGASAGIHRVRVNVTDRVGNYAERNFTITLSNNTKAVWNTTMTNAFIIYENNLTYFNFSQNVTDADGDILNFSFTNDSAFPSFSINSTTGVINFTPNDFDVGYHNITINARDNLSDSFYSFNFTILNVNDNVSIGSLSASGVINATVDANSNVNATEDNRTTITLWIYDDDVKIPTNQKSFYNESFIINLTIQGSNTKLFNFSKTSSYPTALFPNLTEYTAVFTPNKTDVGSYNITINVTDANNFSSAILRFNLTISEKQHNPVLANLTNQTSSINRNLYYNINASDSEDGADSTGNLTFKYNFISGTNFLNATTFNTTSGVLNITFNSSQGGKYNINITVNDSAGLIDYDNFWLDVYDTPNITFPATNSVFNLAENTSFNLTFRANHSVMDNLTYLIYIKNSSNTDVLKYNLSYYGNNTNLTWQFTPNFTEETYGTRNLTLTAINPTYPNLNFSKVYNITINHTNAPVVFSGYIGDSQADYNSVITINLSNYFSDADYSDVNYNQTISFNVSSNSTPSYITSSFSNWTLTFSSLIARTELLNITAIDSNSSNVTSNTFKIEFTTPTTTAVATPSSGGGGGTTPVAFKIITPGQMSAYAYQKMIIPLSLENKGRQSFSKIKITASALKEGNLENEISVSLDKTYVESLKPDTKENLVLTALFNTNDTGNYEILINATSESPKYTDWAKIYINLEETNGSDVKELLIFTEELIASNPECIEITEILNEAKKYLENGDMVNAKEKTEQAINACRESISQPGLLNVKFKYPFTINQSLMIATIGAIILGIFYYNLGGMALRRRLKAQDAGQVE